MKIEILGSGGATLTPRPFSTSRVSVEAREKGAPYSRMGPAYFVHDAALLIDTPEEIGPMLTWAGIQRVEAAVYSHWHPDHTSGLRVFEANYTFWDWPPHPMPTRVYLPPQVAADCRQWLGLEKRLAYLESRNVIQITRLANDEAFQVGSIQVQPLLLAVGYVYAFLIQDDATKVLIIPDETFGWHPPDDLPALDVVIMPAGLFAFDPFNGERLIPAAHPVLQSEATFRQTLQMVAALPAKEVILSHLEEPNGLSYDDYLRLAEQLAGTHPDLPPITFAYDHQIIDTP